MSNLRQDEHLEANRLFAKSLLIICISFVLLSLVSRLCGKLWFNLDPSIVPEISYTMQVIILTLLKLVELTFIFMILCKTKTSICFTMALVETIISGFLSGIILNIFNLFCIIVIPILFNRKDWKHCLIDNIILYVVLFLYSATFLFGRMGTIIDAKFNFVVQVLCTIDYNVFIISIYNVVKLFGGIKLWKIKLFKRDSHIQ